MRLQVGSICNEVLEPLQKLRVEVESSQGLEASIEFDDRTFLIQEPRFTHKFGARQPWNTHAVICPNVTDTTPHSGAAKVEVPLQPGRRHAAHACVTISVATGVFQMTFESIACFQMEGISYGHPNWSNGIFKTEWVAQREDYAFSDMEPLSPKNIRVQALPHFTLTDPMGQVSNGLGVFGMKIVFEYLPLGLS